MIVRRTGRAVWVLLVVGCAGSAVEQDGVNGGVRAGSRARQGWAAMVPDGVLCTGVRATAKWR